VKHGRLLLDTHVFLWWQADHPGLSDAAREAIAAADVVFVSAASAWEAVLKVSIGKLRLKEGFAKGVAAGGFSPLPIDMAHAEAVAELPFHHRDPFDRILIAQAMVEGLAIVTHDSQFSRYGVPVILT
jgi:PIN domain nuclease of toxin-antitoxin system